MKHWLPTLSILALVLLGTSLSALPPSKGTLTTSWTAPSEYSNSTGYNFQPVVIQARDSNVWVFYEFASTLNPGVPGVYYKTYTWSQWASGNLKDASQQTLAASQFQDVAPAAALLPNGTMYVSYSSNRAGNFDIYLKRYNPSTGWSTEYQVTSDSAQDKVSSLVASRDGTLWVFWDRQLATNSNIYYKTYSHSTWSAETALTSDAAPVQNSQPSSYQMKDGRLWAAWSRVLDSRLASVFIYYRIWNGSAWSTPTQQTSTSNNDSNPVIMQDANLTIWLVWSRELPVSCQAGGCYQKDLFYVYSQDNAASWSPEAQITNDQNCSYDITVPHCYDDVQASAVQLDFRIWVFWASTRDTGGYWGIYYVTSNSFPSHDVAIASLSTGPTLLRQGQPVTINLTVSNIGGYVETFTVQVTATNSSIITIATRTLTLSPGSTQRLGIIWDTAALRPARYNISASIQAVGGELPLNQADNKLSGGTVHLVPPGDVNYDGKVDINDAAILVFAYSTKPGDLKWNANADLNGDSRVSILDAAILVFNFDRTS